MSANLLKVMESPPKGIRKLSLAPTINSADKDLFRPLPADNFYCSPELKPLIHSLIIFIRIQFDNAETTASGSRCCGCCGKTQKTKTYTIMNENGEHLFQGFQDPPEACWPFTQSAISVGDLQGEAICEVNFAPQKLCGSFSYAYICAPPGCPIGAVIRKVGWFSTTYDVLDSAGDLCFSVKPDFGFFRAAEYPIICPAISMQIAKITVGDDCKEMSLRFLEPIHPIMKVLLLGFALFMHKTIRAQKSKKGSRNATVHATDATVSNNQDVK